MSGQIYTGPRRLPAKATQPKTYTEAEVQAMIAAAVEGAAERFASHPAIQLRRYADISYQWRWDVYRAINRIPHSAPAEAGRL